MRYFGLGVRCVLVLCVLAAPVLGLAGTSGPFTVTFSDLVVGTSDNPVDTPFSFPKFDASLGHLQSVDIVFSFSGTVMGRRALEHSRLSRIMYSSSCLTSRTMCSSGDRRSTW